MIAALFFMMLHVVTASNKVLLITGGVMQAT